jgi:hypothetical protein
VSTHRKTFQKFLAGSIAVSVAAGTVEAEAASVANKTFTDLTEGEFAYSEVMNLVDKGVITGYGDGTFRPNFVLSRAHAAVLFYRAMELKPSASDDSFADITSSTLYAKEINAVKEKGIFSGKPGNLFDPKAPLTREQMATVLVRTFQLQPKNTPVPLSDLDKVAPTHLENVKILYQNGITTGRVNGEFDPKAPVTRAQFAVFLHRLLVKQDMQTIEQIGQGYVVVNGIKYVVGQNLEEILHTKNKDILKGASLTFKASGNEITEIVDLELVSSGQAAGKGEKEFSRNLVLDGGGNAITGSLSIKANYITVKNVAIKGDLLVGSELQNDFYSDHLSVEGKTIINGGDDNTVVFDNAVLGTMEVNKTGVRVEANGKTTIASIIVSSDATVAAKTGKALPEVTIAGEAKKVTIDADVEKLLVQTSNPLSLSSGKIQVLESKTNAKITAQKGTNIRELILPEGIKLDNAINHKELKIDKIKIGGKVVTPAPPVSGGGGSGSSPSPSDNTAPVITLNGDTQITLTAGDSYNELGAVVTDNVDTNVTLQITKNFTDTNTPGIYKVTYTAVDAAHNNAKAERTVTIKPKPVVITENNGNIEVTGAYTNASAQLTLYNSAHVQVGSSITASAGKGTFTGIAAGTGYYVKQTVNSVTSNPSNSVNVGRPKVIVNGTNPFTAGGNYLTDYEIIPMLGAIYGAADSTNIAHVKPGANLPNAIVEFKDDVNGAFIIQNLKVDGDLILDAGEASTATLNNVTADNIIVKSGAKGTVNLSNVKTGQIQLEDDNDIRLNSDGTSDVGSISLEEGTDIELSGNFEDAEVEVKTGTKLSAVNGFSAGSINVNISSGIQENSLELLGDFTDVPSFVVSSPVLVSGSAQLGTIDVNIPSGSQGKRVGFQGVSIQSVTVSSPIELDVDASIDSLSVNVPVTLSGSGVASIQQFTSSGSNLITASGEAAAALNAIKQESLTKAITAIKTLPVSNMDLSLYSTFVQAQSKTNTALALGVEPESFKVDREDLLKKLRDLEQELKVKTDAIDAVKAELAKLPSNPSVIKLNGLANLEAKVANVANKMEAAKAVEVGEIFIKTLANYSRYEAAQTRVAELKAEAANNAEKKVIELEGSLQKDLLLEENLVKAEKLLTEATGLVEAVSDELSIKASLLTRLAEVESTLKTKRTIFSKTPAVNQVKMSNLPFFMNSRTSLNVALPDSTPIQDVVFDVNVQSKYEVVSFTGKDGALDLTEELEDKTGELQAGAGQSLNLLEMIPDKYLALFEGEDVLAKDLKILSPLSIQIKLTNSADSSFSSIYTLHIDLGGSLKDIADKKVTAYEQAVMAVQNLEQAQGAEKLEKEALNYVNALQEADQKQALFNRITDKKALVDLSKEVFSLKNDATNNDLVSNEGLLLQLEGKYVGLQNRAAALSDSNLKQILLDSLEWTADIISSSKEKKRKPIVSEASLGDIKFKEVSTGNWTASIPFTAKIRDLAFGLNVQSDYEIVSILDDEGRDLAAESGGNLIGQLQPGQQSINLLELIGYGNAEEIPASWIQKLTSSLTIHLTLTNANNPAVKTSYVITANLESPLLDLEGLDRVKKIYGNLSPDGKTAYREAAGKVNTLTQEQWKTILGTAGENLNARLSSTTAEEIAKDAALILLSTNGSELEANLADFRNEYSQEWQEAFEGKVTVDDILEFSFAFEKEMWNHIEEAQELAEDPGRNNEKYAAFVRMVKEEVIAKDPSFQDLNDQVRDVLGVQLEEIFMIKQRLIEETAMDAAHLAVLKQALIDAILKTGAPDGNVIIPPNYEEAIERFKELYSNLSEDGKQAFRQARTAIEEIDNWSSIIGSGLTEEINSKINPDRGVSAQDIMIDLSVLLYSTSASSFEQDLNEFRSKYSGAFHDVFGTDVTVDDLVYYMYEVEQAAWDNPSLLMNLLAKPSVDREEYRKVLAELRNEVERSNPELANLDDKIKQGIGIGFDGLYDIHLNVLAELQGKINIKQLVWYLLAATFEGNADVESQFDAPIADERAEVSEEIKQVDQEDSSQDQVNQNSETESEQTEAAVESEEVSAPETSQELNVSSSSHDSSNQTITFEGVSATTGSVLMDSFPLKISGVQESAAHSSTLSIR